MGALLFNPNTMRSLNRVSLIGNLTADPELHETSTGKKVAHFSLATNRYWKDKEGEDKKVTDYHKITAWQRLGEICGEYLKKGSSIFLEGQLKNRSYETKEGDKRYITEIVAKDVNILTWKKNKNGEVDARVETIDDEESSEEAEE